MSRFRRLLGGRGPSKRAADPDSREGFLERAGEHSPIVVAETDLGFYAVNPADHGKGRKVFLRRNHPADDVLAIAIELLRQEGQDPQADGRWLIDVGAYTGSSVIPAVLRGGWHRALAVEPEPGNNRLLKANIALNDLEDRIKTERCAISDQPGSVTMAVNPRMHGKHAVVSRPETLKGGLVEITVQTDTLDAVLDRAGVPPGEVGLLKIDAQGFEHKVLRGARSLLDAGTPVVIEYAVDELKQQPGALDALEVIVAENFARFADLRKIAAGNPGSFQATNRMPDLRLSYVEAAEAKKLGQRRGVTDLLLLA